MCSMTVPGWQKRFVFWVLCPRSMRMKKWKSGGTCVRRNIDSVAICMLRRAICMLHDFFGEMDISTKPFWFRRKLSILHRKMHIALRNMHLVIYPHRMHVAILKSETSSPNEQTWSNTFHGTLGVWSEKDTFHGTLRTLNVRVNPHGH